MEAPGLEKLAASRQVALYLLSLVATASADLAWRPPSLARLAGHAAALGLALGLGSLLADSLSAMGAAGARHRIRFFVLTSVPLPTFFALSVAWTAPPFAATAASALGLVQVAVLLLADALGLEILVLWSALCLALVAAARGGLPGGVGLTGFLALASVFFALDHACRRLAAWPNLGAPPPGLVIRDALRTAAAPVLLLGIALALLPAPPPSLAGAQPVGVAAPEVRRAYQWLILVALAGAGTLTVVFRWLRGRGAQAPPLLELEETRVEAEELIDPSTLEGPRYAGARNRVIRAYLRFLARAGDAGLQLQRHLTPREIEARVRRPEEPLSRLTSLFMDARYGPDEPTPDDVRRAEAASREVCSGVRPASARRR
jgi:Domain of unknown function (DUF4129)